MSYESIVLCRRRPPQPPTGWPYRHGGVELVLEEPHLWQKESHDFLSAPASQVVVAHQRERGIESHCYDLCIALADASDGVVLERVPVIVIPTYRVEYRGEAVELQWSELQGYQERRRAAATAAAATAEAEKRAAYEANLQTETDKHVLLDALIVLMRKQGGASRHIELMLEPEWLREVSLENLRFMLGKRQEIARLEEANEGLYERWQAHVAGKDD